MMNPYLIEVQSRLRDLDAQAEPIRRRDGSPGRTLGGAASLRAMVALTAALCLVAFVPWTG